MRKELVISSIARETRVAVVEDGELVELLIERGRARGIAGNIYKGKVTKVLPGMQSAFVDIGLERDAFLYVSDFLEDTDEYERMVSSAEDEAFASEEGGSGGRRRSRGGRTRDRERTRDKSRADEESEVEADSRDDKATGETSAETSATEASPAGSEDSAERKAGPRKEAASESGDDGGARGDRRRRGRERRPERDRPAESARSERGTTPGLQVLPGESLAKYRGPSDSGEASVSGQVRDADVAAPPEQPAEAATSEDSNRTESGRQRQEPETPKSAESDEGGEKAGTEIATPADAARDRVPQASDDANEDPGDSGSDTSEATPSAGSVDDAPSPAEGEAPRPARIIDRGRSGELSRRAPSRRGRRRSSEKSETNGKATSGSRAPTISDLLKEGQEILVQVAKEPLGKKGARITSHIALPGRYLVYMPTVDHVGVSRKIESEEERARLRRIIAENRDDLPGGFIVRTAAEGRDEKEFVQDLRFLFDTWKEIREKNESSHAPAVIHADLGLVERVLRDQLTDEFSSIRLDNEVEYTKVLDFVSKFQPSLVNRVKLHLKDTPIFEEYGLQQEIDKALRSKVWLKSGGYIVINQTEALVAIDVNTGKFVGKSNRLEDTIVRTNLDAVHEIVRQIRLRNLGGIIVVDFIDMEERKNRQRVMQALEEELGKDRSPSKILQFNDFGLVAITRKRTQASLERLLGSACPRCSGSGYVKSVETVCYEIQQELRKMVGDAEGNELTVRASPEVAKALKSAEFFDLAELEEEARMEIRIQSDPLLAERFDIYE